MHRLFLPGKKGGQYIPGHLCSRFRAAYAHPDPVEVSGPELSVYGSQSVVPGQSTSEFDPDLPRRKIQLVVDNHDLVGRKGMFRTEPLHRPTADVHVRLGLGQQTLHFGIYVPYPTLGLASPAVVGTDLIRTLLHQVVNDHKTDIVSGARILRPGVSQAD